MDALDVLALACFFSVATPIAITAVALLRVIQRILWRIKSW